ncbi:MAG: SCO family protein [Alloalcanivorax venustensis]|uniref:SCO family protein n=1 Tax=Alloalcanivorax venustensis TaxID=172371 RepID=UPI0032996EC2
MSRLILAAGVLSLPLLVAAQPQTPSQTLGRVGVDQRIGERVPMDLRFEDRHGDTVTLGNLINGKPALLQLAWYDCPNLCDLSLRRLGSRLSDVKFQPGEDFQVVTVSIDPREGTGAADRALATLRDSYQGDNDAGDWQVLTGDARAIDTLARRIGYRYQYDAESEQFAHPAALAVLDGDGRLSSYLLGLTFSGRDVELALTRAGEGRLGSITDRIALRCFHFDPEKGTYTLDILRLLNLACLITALVLALVVGRLLWRRRGNDRQGRH